MLERYVAGRQERPERNAESNVHLCVCQERLHPGLLDGLVRREAQAIEIFGAQQHMDIATRKQHVREIADWFRTSGIPLHSVHSPLYADYEWAPRARRR